MKQYRITSKDIVRDSDEDCTLSPNDPIHEIKAAAYLGGLGGNVRVAELRLKNLFDSFKDKKNESQ